MPKAKNKLTPEEQQKRFEDEVRRQSEAGDLDPDAAQAALDRLIRRARNKPSG